MLRALGTQLGARARQAHGRRATANAAGPAGEPGAESVTAAYLSLLQLGRFLPDASQAAAVGVLQRLQDEVLAATACNSHDTHSSANSASSTGVSANAGSAGAAATTAAAGPASSGGGGAAAAAAAAAHSAVRGAYLWGPVGSGKTAVMDLFASTTQRALGRLGTRGGEACPSLPAGTPRSAVRRHFHEFMQAVHARLHQLQEQRPRVVGRSRQGLPVYRYAEPPEDPLLTVAREWAASAAVLCLDELHITGVADAMILSRLFSALMLQHGVAVVFTSNRPPKDLYKGGLSRHFFEPFIRLVAERMAVVRVGGDVDYRRAAQQQQQQQQPTPSQEAHTQGAAGQEPCIPRGAWLVGPGAEAALEAEWERGAAGIPAGTAEAASASASGARRRGGRIEVPLMYGRSLKVPRADGDAALLTFQQACGHSGLRAGVDDGGALGPPDYLALCRRFRALYVSGVPQLGPAQRDEARRLVTLLDVAYEQRCRLVVAAAVQPDALFALLLEEARRQGANTRVGLAPTSPGASTPPTAAPHYTPAAGGTTTTSAEVAAASAAHVGLGPAHHAYSEQPTAEETQSSGRHHGGPPWPAPVRPGDLLVPRALLGEEVLMYQRAASRLAELCVVRPCSNGRSGG